MACRRLVAAAAVWVAVGTMFLARPATARAEGNFSVGVGYSHLWLNGSDSFRERDGVRFEPRVNFNVIDSLPQLRLGFGLGFSGYSHQLDSDSVITVNDGNDIFVIHADQWESLSFLEPELQISWKQVFDRRGFENHEGFFVEPGVGIGAVVGNYYIATDWWWGGSSHNEWDAAFAARPFLRAGYQTGRLMFGGEASYLFGGNIGLTDQVHGQVQEFYVGGFFGTRW